MNLPRLFKILLIVSLFTVSYLFSIERIETEQIINNPRDYSFSHYENETAISHWYGSETWAVKFVAEDFSALSDTLNNLNPLTITAVNIYFPTIPEAPINVRGFSYDEDSEYDPLFGEIINELNLQNQTITETGWHKFNLSSPYSGEGLWIIVDNLTNFSDNFMASASGSGVNSYYKVTDGDDVFFNSLFDLNITQEFLFSVDGYLNIENGTDRVVIQNVNLQYDYEDLWTYECNIRNYSDELISSADLEIVIEHPDLEVYHTNSLHFTLDLPPMTDTEFGEIEPQYIQLPILDSQYKITSYLRRDSESPNLSSKIIRVCNFQEDSDTALIMNFISSNYQVTDNILGTQRTIAEPNWVILNYGIDGADPLFYSNYAYDYYQDFGVNLFPLTIINGTKYYNSFNIAAIEGNIEDNIYYIPKVFDTITENLEEDGSSLTYTKEFNYGGRFVFDSFTDDLAIDVFITQKTKHYSQEGDEFIVGEISDVSSDFARLSEDGNATYEFTYDVDNVDSLFTTSNGEKFANVIIYRDDTNEIISYSRYSLENNILVSNQENEESEVVSVPTFTVYPNPVNSGKIIHISSTEKGIADYFTLYNIRGQKVGKFKNNNESVQLPEKISSGIYFLQASSSQIGNKPLVKLLIIKE